ncbi:unnamed protein product [Blepharisma stoltei]|uniref:Uncharacterized protein n=1 Tax=Blepharisma stoltei TaxID=1481888 RepID=A0AAU9IX13_9CILI|nr:unnamed protein product [Blepharisma stoltei]
MGDSCSKPRGKDKENNPKRKSIKNIDILKENKGKIVKKNKKRVTWSRRLTVNIEYKNDDDYNDKSITDSGQSKVTKMLDTSFDIENEEEIIPIANDSIKICHNRQILAENTKTSVNKNLSHK